jgi:hypothetical protein
MSWTRSSRPAATPFFIKNIPTGPGDERSGVALSVGYACGTDG